MTDQKSRWYSFGLAFIVLTICACRGESGVRVTPVASPDGGEVWAGTAVDSAFVAIGPGGVYRSANGGDSWTRTGSAPRSRPSTRSSSLNAQSIGSRIFLNVDGEVLRSDDLGANWMPVFENDGQVFVVGNRVYALHSGRLLRSGNAGLSFTETIISDLTPGRDVPFGRIAEVLLESSPQVYISDGQTAWRSMDGGAQWDTVPGVLQDPAAKPGQPGQPGVGAEHAAVGNSIYALLTNGLLLESRDFGMSWDSLSSHITTPRPAVARLLSAGGVLWISGDGITCPLDTTRGVCAESTPIPASFAFVGPSGQIAVTEHGIWRNQASRRWEQASKGLAARITAAAATGHYRFIGANRGIYKSTDSLRTWVRGPATSLNITDLWVAEERVFGVAGDTLIDCNLQLDPCDRRSISASARAALAEESARGSEGVQVLPGTSHVNGGRFYLGARLTTNLKLVVLRSDDLGKTWRLHSYIPGSVQIGSIGQRFGVERFWSQAGELYVLTSGGIFAGLGGNKPPRQLARIPPEWMPSASALAGSAVFSGTSEGLLLRFTTSGDSLVGKRLGGKGLVSPIRSVWVARKHPRAVIVAAGDGILWSDDGGETFSPAAFEASDEIVQPILIDAGSGVLLASGAGGGVFEVDERITKFNVFERVWQKFRVWLVHSSWLQKVLAVLGTLLLGYVTALVVTLWGVRIRFEALWGKPVGVLVRQLPKRAIWALFVRYRRRLKKAFREKAETYYPLPATAQNGKLQILPEKGALINAIANAGQPHRPLWLVGPGGAGKSELLQRVAWEVADKSGPAPWRGFYPILVFAEDYDHGGNLVGAITRALARRHRVPLPPDIVQSLLSSGRFLVLFDGISEINRQGEERSQSIAAIDSAASAPELANCRFILASRYAPAGSVADIELEPLSPKYIETGIPPGLSDNQRQAVANELTHFGVTSVSPLLLTMIVAARSSGLSRLDAQFYRGYFTRLLRIQPDTMEWQGWAAVLAEFANASLVSTGKRGTTLHYNMVISGLNKLNLDGKHVLEDLEGLYGIRHVEGPLPALEHLDQANILLRNGLWWSFRHDKYEDYFAAEYLVNFVRSTKSWPELQQWLTSGEKQREFEGVLTFARELDVDGSLIEHMPPEHPQRWRSVLRGTSNDEPETVPRAD